MGGVLHIPVTRIEQLLSFFLETAIYMLSKIVIITVHN